MILYDVNFIDEHAIGQKNIYDEVYAWYENIWNVDIAYDPLLGLLDYVGLWDFTRNCTCKIGKGLWVRFLCDVTLWTLVHDLLLWHYVKVVIVIWSWYDATHVDVILCW